MLYRTFIFVSPSIIEARCCGVSLPQEIYNGAAELLREGLRFAVDTISVKIRFTSTKKLLFTKMM